MEPIKERVPPDIVDLVRDFRGPTFADELTAAQTNVVNNLPKVTIDQFVLVMASTIKDNLRKWAIEHPLEKRCNVPLFVPTILLVKFQVLDWPGESMETVKSKLMDAFITAFKLKCDGVDIQPRPTIQSYSSKVPSAPISPASYTGLNVHGDIENMGHVMLDWETSD
jgi:hypothetical protein